MIQTHNLIDVSSVTRMGDFFKCLARNFQIKHAQISSDFLVVILKNIFGEVKLPSPLFGQVVTKIGLLFTSTSGHT